jgi:hypothetical protein
MSLVSDEPAREREEEKAPAGPPSRYESLWDEYSRYWDMDPHFRRYRYLGDEWGSDEWVKHIVDTYAAPYLRAESLALDKLTIAGNAELAGVPVLIVRSASKPKFLPGSYDEFWVDPAARYRIVKWVRYQSNKVLDTIEVDYAKNADDDRPVAYRYVRLAADGKPEESHTVSVQEWQINPPVEKADFVLTANSKMMLLAEKPPKK